MFISVYSSREVIRDYAVEHNLNWKELVYAQIYALYECEGKRRKEVADITNYAPSTISTMRSCMWDYEELAKQVFYTNSEEKTEDIVDTPLSVIYRRFKNGHPPIPMEFMPGAGENLKNQQAVYFFKFYSEDGLIFNKIGISKKDVVGRLRQEIGDYLENYPIVRVEIHRIRSCGNCPADGAESALRAALIAIYPEAFRQNDRFFNVDISPKKWDEIVENYLKTTKSAQF